MKMLPRLLSLPFLLALLLVSAGAAASCNTLEWRRGKPFDYYAAETRESTGTYAGGLLHLVEKHHFSSNVRNLVSGQTGALLGDLMFVLTSIPNHPGALDAYSRYDKRYRESALFRKQEKGRRASYTPDCFFDRALRTFPEAAETRVVWAIHKYRNGELDEAASLLEEAIAIQPDYIEAHYNLGLIYASQRKLALAKKHAEVAYEAGYPLSGLQNKIAELEAN